MASVLAELLAQSLFAITERVPEENPASKSTVIDGLVVVTGEAPAVDVAPAGNVQV